MSSFANAHKSVKRTHRERAQPAARGSFGLLEKRKDWKKRRDDFHRKEKTIKALRSKADKHNPDEFYFGMINSKTKDGVHQGEREGKTHFTAEEIKLLKSQDLNYVNLKRVQEARKADKLKEGMAFMGAAKSRSKKAPNQHTVFVDSAKEAANFDAEAYFDTPAELLNQPHLRPRKETLRTTPIEPGTSRALKKSAKSQAKAYEELAQRLEREEKLTRVADGLQMERNLMGKGRRAKIRAASEKGPAVYKWRKERKR